MDVAPVANVSGRGWIGWIRYISPIWVGLKHLMVLKITGETPEIRSDKWKPKMP